MATRNRNTVFNALLGTILLLAATALGPVPAGASEYKADLGTFGKPNRPGDTVGVSLLSQFAKAFGKDTLGHFLWSRRPDAERWNPSPHLAPIPTGGASVSFTDSWSFTLGTGASLKFTLDMLKDTTGLAADKLAVSLTGPSGLKESIPLSSTGHLSTTWANLEAGRYVLGVSGLYRLEGKLVENRPYLGYGATLDFGEPVSAGDVPLPGALVLLGTALAGAGVYGYRKKRTGNTAL